MSDLEKLKLLLQEKKYPYFEEADLQAYLEMYKNPYLTASKLCLLKASTQKSIKIGPISIDYPESSYWNTLSLKYEREYAKESDPTSSGGYITQMQRLDR